jgi:hypothetical protein
MESRKIGVWLFVYAKSRWNKIMRVKILLSAGLVTTLILFISFAFQENSVRQSKHNSNWPTHRQLWETAYRSRGIQIVYPAAPEEFAARYRAYYTARQRESNWFKSHVWSDAEFPADSLNRRSMSLVGAINSNQILQSLLPHLPIKRLPNGFHFSGQDYLAPDDILYLFYPNPQNPAQMLAVLTGNSDRAILDFLQNNQRRLRQVGDYYLAQQGHIVLFGFFKDEGEQAWQFEAAKIYDLRTGQKTVKTTAHFVFVTHGQNHSSTEIEKLAARYEENLANLVKRLAAPADKLASLPRLAVHLWDSAEEKGLFTGNTDLRHVEKNRDEAHLLWVKDLRGDDFFAEAKWFIEKFWGEKKFFALTEGLAVAMASPWHGLGHSGWAARLVQTQNAPPLAELFDSQIGPAESELVRQPLLGSFAAFLLEKFGPEEFSKLYNQWPESGVLARFPQNESWEKLIAEWRAKMQKASPIPLRYSKPRPISSNDFHRGFCYAHEGYQIYNGYVGSRSREALMKLAALSVNAVSITPFGFLRDPNSPAFPGRSDGPNGESDESVVIAKNFAKDYHMRVMLKPHIWMGRGWPGDIRMAAAAAWKTFFDYYERWMRGYAALAEMYDFDMLCVGVELAQTTIGHEQEWRQMITRLRDLYSGPMTYAANWGKEFENLNFWDALDAIGIDCYYPLSEKENPTDAELFTNAQMIVEKIRAVAKKFDKPVLITEIGFTSASQTWKNPHQDDRRARVDLEAQRRCYEAICKALSDAGKKSNDWLAGIYWWKWPSTLEDGGAEDTQFTPNGKPAEKLVAKWYKQIARESLMGGQ